MCWSQLPAELLLQIFGLVETLDKKNILGSCRRWRNLCKDHTLWRNLRVKSRKSKTVTDRFHLFKYGQHITRLHIDVIASEPPVCVLEEHFRNFLQLFSIKNTTLIELNIAFCGPDTHDIQNEMLSFLETQQHIQRITISSNYYFICQTRWIQILTRCRILNIAVKYLDLSEVPSYRPYLVNRDLMSREIILFTTLVHLRIQFSLLKEEDLFYVINLNRNTLQQLDIYDYDIDIKNNKLSKIRTLIKTLYPNLRVRFLLINKKLFNSYQ